MSTGSTSVLHPFTYLKTTISTTAKNTITWGLLSIFPLTAMVLSPQPRMTIFAVMGLIAYSIAFSQVEFNMEDDTLDLRPWQEFLLTLTVILYANALVMVTGVLGAAMAIQYSPLVGLIVAIGYGFWDIETAARGIPFVSIGGTVVFSAAVAIVLHRSGRTALSKLRDLNLDRIRTVIPHAAVTIQKQEQDPLNFIRRWQLRR